MDKIKLVEKLLDNIDELIITGGMAFTFLKSIHNMEVVSSGTFVLDTSMQRLRIIIIHFNETSMIALEFAGTRPIRPTRSIFRARKAINFTVSEQ